MYGAEAVADDSDRTAFRKAEKKYKLYYDQNPKSSKKKKQPRAVDLSEVIDFKSILDSFNSNGELPPGVSMLSCDFDQPVFSLESRPGFYFLPGAISVEEQSHWIRESLTSFPQPHNRTNHNAIYGPVCDLFLAAGEGKILVEEGCPSADRVSESNSLDNSVEGPRWKFYEESVPSARANTSKSIPASLLLRKLRWSTLGLQFDWSKRNYDIYLPHNKIPQALCQLAQRMAIPAMPVGENFLPEAAIVNYFGLGDTLGGHLDDMEADWSKPIVSMSLGCKAIFLLGGKSRQVLPLAMFLRSGDVVLMAGEARECFHVKMIDDAELWGTEKQAAEEAKRAWKNAKRHTRDSKLPPRHKKSKASGSRSSLPHTEAGGSQGTEPLSDMVEEEAPIPSRALHRPNWNVHETDHSSEPWVTTQLIQGLPTRADMEGAADLTSETLESCYGQGLVQSIVFHNELQRRMARNSQRMLEMDNALANCHRTIEQQDEDLRAQHQRYEELEGRLQGLEISHHAMEEELGRTRDRNRELEEKYANPTQLPKVRGFIRDELQGVWRRGFTRCTKEVQRAYPDLSFAPVKSMEEVIAELHQASSSRAPAIESEESEEEET